MSEAKNPFEEALKNLGNASNPFTASAIDLGSDANTANPFESAATDSGTTKTNQPDLPNETPEASEMEQQNISVADSNGESQTPLPSNNGEESQEPVNPLMDAMDEQDKTSVFSKPPVFEHGAVKEDITDVSQTFEDLRIAKADDFPELEDAARVTWDVTYGKVRKTVFGAEAKKKRIGEYKASIETSKEFIDALKKSKDKNPTCVIKPRVTAQSKGDAMPVYKGVFTNLEDAEASDKLICLVPGGDGVLYEIRCTELGKFITPAGKNKGLSEIKAGFIPALPLIPSELLSQIIAFFRSFLYKDRKYEAIANIYWDKQKQDFVVSIPKQTVSAARAASDLLTFSGQDDCRFIHYMDVHSHNVMSAKFSAIDDHDEKATRVYAVIGKLDRFFPEISVRISNGGKFLPINPCDVFEELWFPYPIEWQEQVTFEGEAA